MKKQSYKVVGNKTAADVVANNNEILETGYSLEEAKMAAISYQRDLGYTAAWIEEEEPKGSPALITRSIERNPRGSRISVVRCNGWVI